MTIRKIKTSLRGKAWRLLKARCILNSGITVSIENDNDWFVYNEIFTNKEYDQALARFLKIKPEKPVILDLGANVGFFTLKIADEMYQAGIKDFSIIALEADTSNYNALNKRIDQPLLRNKVKPYWGLAGYKTGSHALLKSNEHFGHSAAFDDSLNTRNKVDYIDVDKLLSDTISKIDFIKCDIEGSEEIFIRENLSLFERTVQCVFEFHARECNVDNCRNMLFKAGLISKGVIKEESKYKTSVEIFSRQ
jgi:FkbM family methyltransferase